MSLTSAQLATWKSDIQNNVDAGLRAAVTAGNWDAVAAFYNAIVSPTFFVYRTNVPVQEIYNQITWVNFTPNDAPDGTVTAVAIWLNRSQLIMLKQQNLSIMLQGQSTIDASKATMRAGIQDATQSIPSGVGGASVSGGWVGIRDNALARAATLIEKLLAVTSGGQDGSTAAKAATMGYQGSISAQNVSDVMDGLLS